MPVRLIPIVWDDNCEQTVSDHQRRQREAKTDSNSLGSSTVPAPPRDMVALRRISTEVLLFDLFFPFRTEDTLTDALALVGGELMSRLRLFGLLAGDLAWNEGATDGIGRLRGFSSSSLPSSSLPSSSLSALST